jgi:LmbE family N-acetylglucosaminyl deacetylase
VKLPGRILFVGAHCDDIELLAGALLHHACASGVEVGVLTFSDHRGVLEDREAAQSRVEMQANVEWLREVTGAQVEDHTDRLLPACNGAFQAERAHVYARLEALRDRYDLVVTHPATDTNQDHQQVAAEAARVFKAHASLLGGEFPSNDIGGFVPHVYVEVSEESAVAKQRLVGRYESQRVGGRPYFDEDTVLGLLRVRGSQIRVRYAEAFAVLGRVRVSRGA